MEQRLGIAKNIWEKEYQWLYGLAGVFAGFLLGVASSSNLSDWLSWFADNFWSETLGITITIVFIDWLYKKRDRENLKKQLVRNAKSFVRDVAVHAIDELRHEGWLVGADSVLIGADLSFANLEGARLHHANLEGANLEQANLTNAKLVDVNLRSADLKGAKLKNASFLDANLEKVDFDGARLHNTNLAGANLCDANFLGAEVKGKLIMQASIKDYIFAVAILPDGSSGEMGDDISRFFEPDHPNVFIASWVNLEEKREMW